MSRRDRRTPSSNPLLANTEEETPIETKPDEAVTPSPVVVPQPEAHVPVAPSIEQQSAPVPVVKQVVETPEPLPPAQPVVAPVIQMQPTYTPPSLPPAPQARRVNRKKVKYGDQFDKRTLSIDRRLLPYFDALMEDGPNKTVVANQWVLKILLDAGYQIDPTILTQPYKKPR